MNWRKVARIMMSEASRLDKEAGRRTARGDVLFGIGYGIASGLEREDLDRDETPWPDEEGPWPTPPDRFEDVEG